MIDRFRAAVLRPWRPRLLPALVLAMLALLGVKVATLLQGAGGRGNTVLATGAASPSPPLLSPARMFGAAQAQGAGPTAPPAAARGTPAPAAAAPAPGNECEAGGGPAMAARQQVAEAERSLLDGLRARRAEIERREQAAAEREVLIAAAERRIGQRAEELTALQQRMEALDRSRTEREEQGWRQMVKLYEGMRPRDAAAIFDELELPVLLQILDRMGERRAAPVLGAMRPERARMATAELARHRAAPRPAPLAGAGD